MINDSFKKHVQEHSAVLHMLLFSDNEKERKNLALLHKNSDSDLIKKVSKKILQGETEFKVLLQGIHE